MPPQFRGPRPQGCRVCGRPILLGPGPRRGLLPWYCSLRCAFEHNLREPVPAPSYAAEFGPCRPCRHPGPGGYGQFLWNRTDYRAHRAAWLLASGDEAIPAGGHVLHICDVRLCAQNEGEGTYEVGGVSYRRFGHLFLGDHAANMRDKREKGRARGPRRKTVPGNITIQLSIDSFKKKKKIPLYR